MPLDGLCGPIYIEWTGEEEQSLGRGPAVMEQLALCVWRPCGLVGGPLVTSDSP